MNLISEKIRSKAFGIGIIIEQTNTSILVAFAEKQSKFSYPDAFEKFIAAENMVLQSEILALIENKKKECEFKKEADAIKIATDKYSQDFLTKGYNKKFDKEYHVDFLAKHPILTYQQVEKQYGIKISGFGRGINATNDSIVLISSIEKRRNGFVYHDYFTSEGDFIYSGEGKSGDQTMKSGNLALKNTDDTRKNIYLFVKFSPQEYYYQGIYTVTDFTYEDEKDVDGNMRKELKFRLKKTNE